MFVLNKYSLLLLRIQICLGHLSAVAFLSFLVFLFMGWLLASRRNYVIMLYTISFSLGCTKLLVSLAYLDTYFSNSSLPDVRPYSMTTLIKESLKRNRPKVSAFIDPAMALEDFKRNCKSCGLILSDIRMPGMNGYELVKQAKQICLKIAAQIF